MYCVSSNYEGFKAHPQYGANVHITRSASNVLLMTLKYAKSIVIIHETIAIVCGDWIAALCKLLKFTNYSGYDLPKGCHWDRVLRVSGSRRGGYGLNYLSYLSDDDLLPLVVDAKGQMARFVVKNLSVCNKLVVLMFCTTWRQRLLLSLKRWALLLKINANLRQKIPFRNPRLYLVLCPYPGSDS